MHKIHHVIVEYFCICLPTNLKIIFKNRQIKIITHTYLYIIYRIFSYIHTHVHTHTYSIHTYIHMCVRTWFFWGKFINQLDTRHYKRENTVLKNQILTAHLLHFTSRLPTAKAKGNRCENVFVHLVPFINTMVTNFHSATKSGKPYFQPSADIAHLPLALKMNAKQWLFISVCSDRAFEDGGCSLGHRKGTEERQRQRQIQRVMLCLQLGPAVLLPSLLSMKQASQWCEKKLQYLWASSAVKRLLVNDAQPPVCQAV